MRRCDRLDIVWQLLTRRANVADTHILVLRAASSTKDLQYVQNSKIDHFSLLSIVHVRAFNDNRIGRQVHTPCQSRRTTQYTRGAGSEEALTQITIRAQHTCVVNPYAMLE